MQEWLGGNATVVETNYFGKGNTTTYNRATYVTVDDPQDNWHTYTIDWTSQYVKWYVDGGLVRTLLYADALDGQNFPQTPMRIKIGNVSIKPLCFFSLGTMSYDYRSISHRLTLNLRQE
jgi:beta-glucanase (GH16 family)